MGRHSWARRPTRWEKLERKDSPRHHTTLLSSPVSPGSSEALCYAGFNTKAKKKKANCLNLYNWVLFFKPKFILLFFLYIGFIYMCVCVCVYIYKTWNLPFNHFLSVEFSGILIQIVQLSQPSISSTFPSSQTETLHPFNNPSYPISPQPWQPSFYFPFLWIWLL